MVRLTAILLLLWTLLLGPALCMGGLLEHACGCESEAACQHEDRCATDPCSEVVKQADGEELLGYLALRALVELPAWQSPAAESSCPMETVPLPVRPDLPRYACAPSDRPLRI